MRFFLKMNPPTVTAQMHKVCLVHGRPVFYDPPKVRQARQQLRMNLRIWKPERPLDGALELRTMWLFPRGRSHRHNQWRTTRPDTDNLQKLLKDCMTAEGFWKDDAQVVMETAGKKWSDEPCGIEIEILELDGGAS